MLVDTAGIREARGRIEAEGISRALARVEDADLVLWLVDATAPLWQRPGARCRMNGERTGRATIAQLPRNLRIEQDRSDAPVRRA